MSRSSREAPAPDTDELLSALLARLNIANWDVLLVGDGSGSGWTTPCGWASILVDRVYHGRQLFYGAMNLGSVNLGESMPYLHALSWYDAQVGKTLLRQTGQIRVHIVTDSATVANWGTKAMQLGEPLPRKHIGLWATMREYRQLGYTMTFHWAPRMTTGFNWAADLVAGLARVAIRDMPLDADLIPRAIAGIRQADFEGSLYQIHPEE